MQVKGKLHTVKETQVVSEKFKKREFVVETEDQYPQLILIQLTQDRVDLINLFEVGDSVTVSINLRGRSWENPQGEVKYFNTVEAWRIEGEAADKAKAPAEEEVDESLPF
jgi:single-strand DNA-binding protein